MIRLVVLPLVLLAAAPFESSIRPLPEPMRATLEGPFWKPGCPVSLSQLRLLTVSHWGFDGQVHEGQIVVNRSAAAPLARVFRRLYDLRFPIRHARFEEVWTRRAAVPRTAT